MIVMIGISEESRAGPRMVQIGSARLLRRMFESDSCDQLIHRVAHAPFAAQSIHLTHYVDGLLMRHHRRLRETGLQTALAFQDFIFVSIDHIVRLVV